MKYYLLFPILFLITSPVFAQDTTKINSSKLLEYYQDRHFDQAVNYLKKAYPEPITNIKALNALAYCSQMDGKLPVAESYYERVYAADSTNIAVLYNLGSINLNRGNNARAEKYYKKIILKDSLNYIVYKQLAKISIDKEDILVAINYLMRANKLNPEDANVASDLSDILVKLKSYPTAEAVLNKAIQADPENLTLLHSLVKLEYAQKKWPETIETGEKLRNLGDLSSVVLSELGIAYYNNKNYKCGIETFALMEDANQTEVTYYYTGSCYKALKDHNNAIVYFKKTIYIGISPNINNYYCEIADSYETIKNYPKAASAYKKALQFAETPLTYYLLANLYDTKLKSRKQAVLYYRKYLTITPKDQITYIAYAKSRVETLSR